LIRGEKFENKNVIQKDVFGTGSEQLLSSTPLEWKQFWNYCKKLKVQKLSISG